MVKFGRPARMNQPRSIHVSLEQDVVDHLDEVKGDLSRGELLSHLIMGESMIDAKSAAVDEKRVKTLESENTSLAHKVDELEIRLNTKKAKAQDKLPMMVKALRGVERREGEIPTQMLLTWMKITGLSEIEIYGLLSAANAPHQRVALSSEDEAELLKSKKSALIRKSKSAAASKLVADDMSPVGFEKGKYLL